MSARITLALWNRISPCFDNSATALFPGRHDVGDHDLGPSATKRSAIAWPMPLAPPVTIVALPLRFMGVFL